MSDWFEREEEALYRDFELGRITREQLNMELRELRRGYRESAEDAARDAYDREMDRW